MTGPLTRATGRWIRSQLPGSGVAYLVAFVNTRCEQDCRTCFVRPEADDKLLTPGELERVGRGLGGLIQLTVTGGEPTLRPDLPDAVAAIALASGVPFISLHTNGFAPERIERQVQSILEKVPGSLLSVRVSVDGLGPLHDVIRRREDSWERWEDTMARLSALRTAYGRLRVFTDTVACHQNQESLGSLGSYLDGWDGRIDGRELLLLRGGPRDESSHLGDGSRYRDALVDFLPGMAEHGRTEVASFLPEAARRAVYRQVLAVAENRGKAVGCTAAHRFAVLGSEGEVAPCEMRSGWIGNVRDVDHDLEAVLGGATGIQVRREIRRGDCADGCTHECAALASVALRPSRLAAAALRHRRPVAAPRAGV